MNTSCTGGFGRKSGTVSLLLCFVIVTSVPVSAAPEGEAEQKPTKVFERFKQYLQNPPPVQEITFRFQRGPDIRRTSSGQSIRVQSPALWIRASWSPDILFSLSTTNEYLFPRIDLSDPLGFGNAVVVIQDHERYWSYFAGSRTLTMWERPSGAPRKNESQGNAVLAPFEHEADHVFTALCMGPHFAHPGGWKWEGNKFEFESRTPSEGIVISGELFADNSGLPEKMTLHYMGQRVDGRYVVEYRFGSNSHLPAFLPERIRSTLVSGNLNEPVHDIQILSYKVAEDSVRLPANPFQWKAVVGTRHQIFTNSILYRVENDKLKAVGSLLVSQPPLQIAYVNRYYYAYLFVISCAAISLVRVRRNRISPCNENLKPQVK